MKSKKYKVGMYGGKFMPFHKGHLYCVEQAAKQCETLYVLLFHGGEQELEILKDERYSEWLDPKKREETVKEACRKFDNVIVKSIDITKCKKEDGTEDWEAETPLVLNSSIFEKMSVTADILIMSISVNGSENYRKSDEIKWSILLVKRNTYPFKDKWCLPGGFVDIKETIEEAAKRILKNETNLENVYLEQLYTFSNINRDPRLRVVSTSYMSLIDKNKLDVELVKNASWFDINITEMQNRLNIKLENHDKEIIEFSVKKDNVKNFHLEDKDSFIESNNQLAFDHEKIITTGIERLKNKIEYTDLVFSIMPEYFTLGELQRVYEIILNKKLIAPNFRRTMENKITKTDKFSKGKGHRPSVLYTYNKRDK